MIYRLYYAHHTYGYGSATHPIPVYGCYDSTVYVYGYVTHLLPVTAFYRSRLRFGYRLLLPHGCGLHCYRCYRSCRIAVITVYRFGCLFPHTRTGCYVWLVDTYRCLCRRLPRTRLRFIYRGRLVAARYRFCLCPLRSQVTHTLPTHIFVRYCGSLHTTRLHGCVYTRYSSLVGSVIAVTTPPRGLHYGSVPPWLRSLPRYLTVLVLRWFYLVTFGYVLRVTVYIAVAHAVAQLVAMRFTRLRGWFPTGSVTIPVLPAHSRTLQRFYAHTTLPTTCRLPHHGSGCRAFTAACRFPVTCGCLCRSRFYHLPATGSATYGYHVPAVAWLRLPVLPAGYTHCLPPHAVYALPVGYLRTVMPTPCYAHIRGWIYPYPIRVLRTFT